MNLRTMDYEEGGGSGETLISGSIVRSFLGLIFDLKPSEPIPNRRALSVRVKPYNLKSYKSFLNRKPNADRALRLQVRAPTLLLT